MGGIEFVPFFRRKKYMLMLVYLYSARINLNRCEKYCGTDQRCIRNLSRYKDLGRDVIGFARSHCQRVRNFFSVLINPRIKRVSTFPRATDAYFCDFCYLIHHCVETIHELRDRSQTEP